MATAIDNFVRLGLVSFSGPLHHKPVYEMLEGFDIVQQHLRREIPAFKSKLEYKSLKVTDFGQMFIDACIIEQHIGLAPAVTESTDNA